MWHLIKRNEKLFHFIVNKKETFDEVVLDYRYSSARSTLAEKVKWKKFVFDTLFPRIRSRKIKSVIFSKLKIQQITRPGYRKIDTNLIRHQSIVTKMKV